MKDYFKLYREYQTQYGDKTVLLMQCGGFYEVYQYENEGYNIKELSQIMNVQYTKRNKSIELSTQNPYMLGFPLASLKKYKKVLTDYGLIVVVYHQTETLKGKIERHKTGVYTYATNVDEPEDFFTQSANDSGFSILENNIIAILLDEDNSLTACRLDLMTGKGSVLINPYEDLHQQISLLHRFIQTHNTREIIYSGSESLRQLLSENIDTTSVSLQPFEVTLQKSVSYQNEVLSKIYGNDNLITPIEKLGLERYPGLVTVWVMVIDYAYSHVPKIVSNLSQPDFYEEHSHLMLENNAIEQLNLVSMNNLSKKFQSVFNVVNNCSTTIGKRYLKKQLLQPLNSVSIITQRYEASTLLFNDIEKVEENLNAIADIEKLQRKLNLSILTYGEMLQLHNSYTEVCKIINSYDWQKCEFLKDIPDMSILEEMNRFYSFDGFQSESYFNTGIYKEVDTAIEEINLQKNLVDYLHKFLNKLVCIDEKKELNAVHLESNERDGFYFTVSLKRSYGIKHQVEKLESKIIEHNIDMSKLVFKQQPKSPTVKIYYDDKHFNGIKDLMSDLKELLKKYWVQSLEELSAKFKEQFDNIVEWVSRVDFIKSNVKTSRMYKYSCPEIKKNKKSFFKAKGLRHPIIERLVRDKEPYVSHTISLGTSKPDGILLYGLNSAGKSSLMKAIGICIIMAQAGLWVACEELTFSPYKTIFTRITGNDNIFKGLSSFTLEMLEINNILKRSDENCLVIGDEICRGTETISACSIVSSLLIILAKRKCSFIFASHLHDLAQIRDIKELDNMKIYHLRIEINDKGDLVYHRELTPGLGDTVYGIKIAKYLIKDRDFDILTDRMREIHTQLYNQGHKNGHNIELKIVEDKRSKYNSNKFVSHCEICGKKATHKGELETHHIIHQEDCQDGFIKEKGLNHLEMNSKWNLKILCSDCHDIKHSLEKDRNRTILGWKNQGITIEDIKEKLKLFEIELSLTTIKRLK